MEFQFKNKAILGDIKTLRKAIDRIDGTFAIVGCSESMNFPSKSIQESLHGVQVPLQRDKNQLPATDFSALSTPEVNSNGIRRLRCRSNYPLQNLLNFFFDFFI